MIRGCLYLLRLRLGKVRDAGELTLVCHQCTVEVERVFFLSFQIL